MRKVTIKLLLSLAFFTGFATITLAQDIAMPFTNPLYLNPGYAGDAGCPRLAGHFRYDDLKSSFFLSTSFDKLFGKASGVGLQVTAHVLSGGLRSESYLDAFYAHNFKLGSKLSLKPAVSFGLTRNHNRNTNYLDTRVGFVAVYDDLDVGFSIDHLNKPYDGYYTLHHRYFFHARYELWFNDHVSLAPAVLYSITPDIEYSKVCYQSLMLRNRYINIGFGLEYLSRSVSSYKGMVGYINDRLTITYGIDFISNIYTQNSVANELSVVYRFLKKE